LEKVYLGCTLEENLAVISENARIEGDKRAFICGPPRFNNTVVDLMVDACFWNPSELKVLAGY